MGETLSSGTSAVAVAAATHGEGEVVVSFPGGDLRVRLEDGRAWLTGPAERVGWTEPHVASEQRRVDGVRRYRVPVRTVTADRVGRDRGGRLGVSARRRGVRGLAAWR